MRRFKNALLEKHPGASSVFPRAVCTGPPSAVLLSKQSPGVAPPNEGTLMTHQLLLVRAPGGGSPGEVVPGMGRLVWSRQVRGPTWGHKSAVVVFFPLSWYVTGAAPRDQPGTHTRSVSYIDGEREADTVIG